jgi:acetyl esterase/lipase
MKRYFAFLTTLLLILFFTSCKTKKKNKHVEEAYDFKGATIENIAFTENEKTGGKAEDLQMDLYMPRDTPQKKYPLMVFIHGGGFRVGEKTDNKDFCQMIADKGFTVASIDYRTGWEKENDPCSIDTFELKVAVYRAMQDTRAALRYLAANANKYSIDTNWVFIGGSSAGGILSLTTAYYSQDSANIFFGPMVDTLGKLDSYGNSYTTHYTIKGIDAMWGGLNSPYLIRKENAIPTIFFHGEKDRVVPYSTDYFYSCSNLIPSYGTKPLYNRMVEIGVPAVAYIDSEGGHGVYTSNFRAQKASDFFHSIMQNKIQTGFFVADSSGKKKN